MIVVHLELCGSYSSISEPDYVWHNNLVDADLSRQLSTECMIVNRPVWTYFLWHLDQHSHFLEETTLHTWCRNKPGRDYSCSIGSGLYKKDNKPHITGFTSCFLEIKYKQKTICLKSIPLDPKMVKLELKQNTSIKLDIYVPATTDGWFADCCKSMWKCIACYTGQFLHQALGR